jgi:hypothetical protein
MIYETDTNRVLVYDNSAWVMIADTDTPPGMQLVGSFTANGTSSTLTCDNIFTTEFENYQVVARLNSTSQNNGCFFQYIDSSGSLVTAGYYSQTYLQDFASSGSTSFTTQYTNVAAYVGYLPNSGGGASMLGVNMTIYSPLLSTVATAVSGQNSGIRSGVAFLGGQILSQSTNTTSHRGIRFGNDSTTNLTGTVRVYGLRNS